MSYCSACGTRQEPGATLCPNCGNALGGPQAAPVPPPAAPPPAATRAPAPSIPPYAGPQPGYPMATLAQPPTSTAAILSLVLGIASYVFLPFIGAIGAVIAGHMARKEIRDSQGRIKGDGMALAGLILGYAHFALACLAVGLFLLFIGAAAAGASQ